MTLDEAIKHCHEKTEHLREGVRISQSMTATEKADCIECAREHEQLAEWLSHYKEIREIINEWSCDLWSINETRTQMPDSYYFQKILNTFENRGKKHDNISGDDSTQPED